MKRNILLLIVTFTLLGRESYSQSSEHSLLNDTLSAYVNCLQIHLNYHLEFKNRLGIPGDRYSYIVEGNPRIVKRLPSKIDSFNVAYLSPSEVWAKAGKKESIRIIQLQAQKFNKDTMVIIFNDCSVRKPRKKNVDYSYSDGSYFELIYDINRKSFVIINSKHFGI